MVQVNAFGFHFLKICESKKTMALNTKSRVDATAPALADPNTAAKYLAISPRSLWSITEPRGPIRVVRIGRLVRYPLAELQRYISENLSAK